VKTVAVNSEVRQAYTEIAATRQNIYAETQPDVSAKVASIFQ
jgi:NAD(P)H-quinone oxidoreductase subunit 4